MGWASSIRRYAPTYGVGSAVIDWSIFLKTLVDKSSKPNLKAETFDASFNNGGVVPQPFEAQDGKIVSADIQRGYLAVVRGLASGKIALPKSAAHPCCQ